MLKKIYFVMLFKRDIDFGFEVLVRVCLGWLFYYCF